MASTWAGPGRAWPGVEATVPPTPPRTDPGHHVRPLRRQARQFTGVIEEVDPIGLPALTTVHELKRPAGQRMERMHHPHSIRMLLSTRTTRSRQRDRTTSPSAARKPRNAIRPSPAPATPWTPSPDGAAYAAISTRPPPTASPHLTPSAARSQANPGYRHCPPQPDANSRHSENGHPAWIQVSRADATGNRSWRPRWMSITVLSVPALSRRQVPAHVCAPDPLGKG